MHTQMRKSPRGEIESGKEMRRDRDLKNLKIREKLEKEDKKGRKEKKMKKN